MLQILLQRENHEGRIEPWVQGISTEEAGELEPRAGKLEFWFLDRSIGDG